MIGTAALLGTAALGLGSSVVSGLFGKSAADKAADAQVQSQQKVIDTTKGAVAGGQSDVAAATGQANDVLNQATDRQTNLYKPFVDAGTTSLTSLKDLASPEGELSKQFSFNPSDLASDPGYAFTLKQGQDAIARANATRGNLFSGSTLKSLADYTEGASNQYFGDAFNRAKATFDTNRQGALSRISTLQGLAGMGLSGTSGSSAAIGSTAAQQSGNLVSSGNTRAGLGMQGADITGRALTGQGNSQAAGIVGGTNAVTGAISNGSRAINDFLMLRGINGTTTPTNYGPGGGVINAVPANYAPPSMNSLLPPGGY